MKQFGRAIRLNISNKRESIVIDKLKVNFDISKDIKPEPNEATISIYNLNDIHRNLLTSKEYDFVELFVSYIEDELRMIFCGDVIKVENKRDGLDIITILKCADGHLAYTEKTIIKTMQAGQTDSDFLTEALASFGIKKNTSYLPNDRVLPRGKVMMCDTREVMNKIALNNNADWSIQDNELVILPQGKAIKNNEGFIISSQTGMIGSPEKTDDGLKVTTLCNPHFKIGGLVRVESIIKEHNGDYKILSINHSSDFLENDWISDLELMGGI